MFGACNNFFYFVKMGIYPLLVAIQLAFYLRFEHTWVKEVDEEPKILKKG